VHRLLPPFVLALALAGCGGRTETAQRTETRAHVPARFEQIVDAFGEHGEVLAVEPDLTGDDFLVSFERPWLPQPVVLLSRRDGDVMVYVYRSADDVDQVTSVPRTELVFRPVWQLLHRKNVLVITVVQGSQRERIAAALDELSP
jgi:hypothetical protein